MNRKQTIETAKDRGKNMIIWVVIYVNFITVLRDARRFASSSVKMLGGDFAADVLKLESRVASDIVMILRKI